MIRTGKSTIGLVIQGGTKTSLFDYGSNSSIRTEHSSFPSLTKRTMMALSQKWDEVPQAASCGDFLAMWRSGHTLPHTNINAIAYLMVFDGCIFSFCQADKHETPITSYQSVSTWLFDLWCIWLMDKFIKWQKQLRISHNCLDLQATRKSFSCSDIKLYVTDNVTCFYTQFRLAGRQDLTENKTKSVTAKHFSFI